MLSNEMERQRKFDKAMSCLDKAIAINPDIPELYFEKALLNQFTFRNFNAAINDYSKTISLKPHDYDAFFNRADCKKQIGDLYGALNDYSSLISLKSDFIEAYNCRANIKLLLSDLNGALNDFNTSISLCTKHQAPSTNLYITYFNRANIKWQMKNDTGAINDYFYTLKLNPSFPNAWFNLGNINFALKDSLNACLYWNKASKLGYVNAKNMLSLHCK